MNSIVPMRAAAAPSTYDKNALALIKRTVAADCNDDEFGRSVTARALNLDPFQQPDLRSRLQYCSTSGDLIIDYGEVNGFRAIAEGPAIIAPTKMSRPLK